MIRVSPGRPSVAPSIKLGIAKPRITESRCLQYELVFA
jgi:hypothetical protein